ncbi:MAG TPA: M36 family metallopeptidase, partial [Terriglobales bacterium]|nr:M36 family metallopeptidase [Terriglobales bacterium]
IKDVPRKGTPRAAAESFLRGIAKQLRLRPDLRDLKFDKVVESPLGAHVFFQQYHDKKPITGAWVKVDLDPENRAYHFTNSAVPVDLLEKSAKLSGKPSWTAAAAQKKAMAAVEATAQRLRGKVSSELVNFPVGKTVEPAWKFLIPLGSPPHDWRIYISARDGSVLHKEDMLKMATGKGQVFDPNPVITLNNTKLRNSKPVPDAAYKQVQLLSLAKTGLLDGPYVSTSKTKNRAKATDRQFLFKRNQAAFKEVMVYFHIDRMQRYIQSLGFANVNRRPIPVNIAGLKDDNSFYSPVNKSLAFGTGGVDDAEDAEIILHEYGHSIQDAQVPGFGASDEAGAMGEGFGDYLAGSFFNDLKPAHLQNCVGSWDATAYSPDDPPCLRRLDSNKRYPKDIVKEVHADGEIWSACLWQIRLAMGRTPADKLILSHHFLLQRDASFEDAAHALLQADQRLSGGTHKAVISDIFVRRGILPSAKRKSTGFDPFRRSNRPTANGSRR